MIIARVLAIIAGALILGAVAHVTIMSTNGYGTAHAYLTMTVAVGVAVASVICGMAPTRGLIIFLCACIACGEAYNFLQTSNRLTAAAEAAQAPKREHAKAFAKAEADVRTAQASVDTPATSQRLKHALHAKEVADQAVIDKSAEKGCRENCRQLLQAAVDSAADEITRARAAIEAAQRSAKANLETAKATLAVMPAPESPTPFADRIGMPAWAFDVLVAFLGSIAANGLACGLMIFGAHRLGHKAAPPQSVPIIDITPVRVPDRPRPRLATATRQAIGAAFDFLHDGLEIVAGPRTEMTDAFIEYAAWCRAKALRAMDVADFVDDMEELCKRFGIRTVTEGERYYLLDVRVAGAAPKRLGPMPWKRREKP